MSGCWLQQFWSRPLRSDLRRSVNGLRHCDERGAIAGHKRRRNQKQGAHDNWFSSYKDKPSYQAANSKPLSDAWQMPIRDQGWVNQPIGRGAR
jgi:hypothetical protein